jgi:hypothetical protein
LFEHAFRGRDDHFRAALFRGFVEQKNGAVVRRLIGYGRFQGINPRM